MSKHGKGREGTVTTTIDVDVTPGPTGGDIVLCEIDGTEGPYYTGGVIFLKESDDYVINFNLKPGQGGRYTWAADPFWARKGKCPTGPGLGQFSSAIPSGDTLTVKGPGQKGRSAVHFRLNLKDPSGNPVYCDPIMINT